MENQSTEKKPAQHGKKVLGFAILAVGLALFAKEMGAQLPEWLFSWPMLLIVIGIASGIKHRFKNSFWMISLLVGGVFLAERISPELSVAHFTWPAILIGLGIFFIFSKGFDHNGCNRRAKWRREKRAAFQDFAYTEAPKNEEPATDKKAYRVAGGDYIDSVSVFGGTKKNILSKDFKGGEVVNILGGAELNFYNADIEGVVVLDVTQIFGGIDDRRGLNQVLTDRSKVLVIKGTSIFGGIDIRNF